VKLRSKKLTKLEEEEFSGSVWRPRTIIWLTVILLFVTVAFWVYTGTGPHREDLFETNMKGESLTSGQTTRIRSKALARYYSKSGHDNLIRVDYHGSKEVPTGTCRAILKAAGIRERQS
jgi:hypothetical protein